MYIYREREREREFGGIINAVASQVVKRCRLLHHISKQHETRDSPWRRFRM